jgi:hypothetical protein
MKTLVAILTSGKIDKLKRCILSATSQTNTQDVVVIINTLNDEYAQDAVELSKALGVAAIITPSNGKPGKGKNELIKYFLSTDYTHVIPVDGDDILLPTAKSILTDLTQSTHADVIGLINGLALLNNEKLTIEDWYTTETYRTRVVTEINQKDFRKFNLHLAKIRKVSTEYGNFFNRLVMLSRNAASYVNYDEILCGAEDIRQGLLLKLLHHEGKLKYVIANSSNLYLYDVTDLGIYFQLLCKSDPDIETSRFWNNIPKEQINSLMSFQLERIDNV